MLNQFKRWWYVEKYLHHQVQHDEWRMRYHFSTPKEEEKLRKALLKHEEGMEYCYYKLLHLGVPLEEWVDVGRGQQICLTHTEEEGDDIMEVRWM